MQEKIGKIPTNPSHHPARSTPQKKPAPLFTPQGLSLRKEVQVFNLKKSLVVTSSARRIAMI